MNVATHPDLVSSLSPAEVRTLVLPIEDGDREEVRAILAAVTDRLLALPIPPRVARTRLEAVVSCLIDVIDALDGDADLEPDEDAETVTAIEAHGAGFGRTPLSDPD